MHGLINAGDFGRTVNENSTIVYNSWRSLLLPYYLGDYEQVLKELLVIRRTRKEGKKKKEALYEYKYSFSNVEYGKYSWLQLGQVQAQRYFVERGFQDAKKEVGMSEYQIRGWLAWHHHIALVMLGLLFILQEKVEFKDDWPLLTAADIRQIIVEKYARNKNIYDTIKRRHKRRDEDIKRHKKKVIR